VDLGEDPQPVAALFTTPDRVEAAAAWTGGDRYATGLLPLAMPLRTMPPGYLDYVVEVRNYGDHFRAARPVADNDRAVAGPVELSHLEVCQAAAERAAELGVAAGDRVLIDALAYRTRRTGCSRRWWPARPWCSAATSTRRWSSTAPTRRRSPSR